MNWNKLNGSISQKILNVRAIKGKRWNWRKASLDFDRLKSIWCVIFYSSGGNNLFVEEDPNYYEDLYEQFEDAGHSPSAYKMLKKYYIGDLKKD